MRRKAMGSFVAAAAVCMLSLAVVGGAGAGGTGAAGSLAQARIDAVLLSIGVDPATVKTQRGRNNYAGPNCPGKGWNCTTAKRVVQMATYGGSNRFECEASPPSDPPSADGPVCVIVQFSASDENQARCIQFESASTATLSCSITQFNTEGGNSAVIEQIVDQRSGHDQDANVSAFVDQTTTGRGGGDDDDDDDDDRRAYGISAYGSDDDDDDDDDDGGADNRVEITQRVSQSTTASTSQTQDAIFDADVEQSSVFGSNDCNLSQRLNQIGRSSLASVNQTQNGDQEGEVFQQTGEDEGETLSFTASSSDDDDGESGGNSECEATQVENKQLFGKGVQTQNGPQACCASQFGSPDDEIEIRQTSIALAFGGTVKTQNLQTEGTFNTDGNGVIVHNLRVNNDQTSETVSGTGFQTLFSVCSTADCESFPGGGSG